MAPIIKTSLAVISLSLVATAASHNAPGLGAAGAHGKHLKLVKRTLFEDLGKREQFAPYGYDRCGVPRTKPYVKRQGASPSPSAHWKPCPEQSNEQKAQADPAVPTQGDEDEGEDDSTPAADATDSSNDQPEEAAPVTSAAAQVGGNGNGQVKAVAPGNANATPASSASKTKDYSSTQYTTSYVDVTSTKTWSPEAPASSSSSKKEQQAAPAPSSSSSEAAAPSSDEGVFVPGSENGLAKGNSGKGNGNGNGNNGNGNNGNGNNNGGSPSTSSAAAVYTPPASTPNTGGAKLGLAWDWQNDCSKLPEWQGAGVIYTWSAFPPSCGMPAGLEWFPQYWGPGKQGDIQSQIARGVIHPGMTILGYNEPDQAGQANLGVWDAIASFKSQLTPLASQGYKIASPACTSDDKGFNWIKEFMDNCKDCGISYLQTHFYGNNADDFIAYISKLRQFGLPIIISEYASETFGYGKELSLDETKAFVSKTQNWLKQQSDIIAYCYFGPVTPQAANGVNHNSLMIDSGSNINDLGRQYLSNA